MTLYGVVAEHPSQKPLIAAHCFGDCGKIIVGALWVGQILVLPCRTDPCPYLDVQLLEPCGEVAVAQLEPDLPLADRAEQHQHLVPDHPDLVARVPGARHRRRPGPDVHRPPAEGPPGADH